MKPNFLETDSASLPPAILCQSQRVAVASLVAVARARNGSLAHSIDPSLLPIWSVPLLVGPAGAGKEFVCREAARQLLQPFFSVNLGCWVLSSNSDERQSTTARVKEFQQKNPAGVLYFSNMESFTSRTVGEGGGHNVIYTAAVAAELEDLLRETCGRARAIKPGVLPTPPPTPLVVLAGRFASFWGEIELGGASGANAWKNGDNRNASAEAFEEWVNRGESGLPSNLLRWMHRPFQTILRPLRDEAEALASEALRRLPMLDGALDPAGLASALAGAEGWGALRRHIEDHLIRITLAGETEADALLAAGQEETAEFSSENELMQPESNLQESERPAIPSPKPTAIIRHGDSKQPPTISEALTDPSVARCAVLARLNLAWAVELLRSCALREEELASDAQLRWGEGTLAEVSDILLSRDTYNDLLDRRRVFTVKGPSTNLPSGEKPQVIPGPLLAGTGKKKSEWTPGLLRLDSALRTLREYHSKKKNVGDAQMIGHFMRAILACHSRLAPLSRLDAEASLEAVRAAIDLPSLKMD